MTTLAALKKQIAALESQIERETKAETTAAIAKVKKLMADTGVTIEHLIAATQSRGAAKGKTGVRVGSGASTKAKTKLKVGKPPKYADPKTGATWSGLGRTPAWIAGAKNRDDFLIDKPAAGKPAAKKAVAKAKPAKTKQPLKRAVRKAAAQPEAVAA
jgi:DNA-binding protein H-NS